MTKTEQYDQLLSQFSELIDPKCTWVANFANTVALISDTFNHWWVGFYLVRNNELQLGPFQGPVACTRIGYGKGVCGTSWQQKQTLIVPDVHQFPGHIACSAASNSEIVVPVIYSDMVVGVLDIDSTDYDTFDETDKLYLEKIALSLGIIYGAEAV